MKKIWPGILLVILGSNSAFSQNTQKFQDSELLFERAMDLFDKQKYNPARTAFQDFIEISNDEKRIEAEYYSALSGLYLYHNDAVQKLKYFQDTYKKHPKSARINYELGVYYYRKQNFPEASNYFKKVDYDNLSREERIETQFKLAYSLFTNQEFDQAEPLFNSAKGGNHKYSSAAYYYCAIIEYKKAKYSESEKDFKMAAADKAYEPLVPEMLANIYYKQKKYDELEKIGQDVLNSKSVRNKSAIYLILADSYYERKNYSKAFEYFENYSSGMRSKPEAEISYRMAYSAFVLDKTEFSKPYFEEAALKGSDTLIQMASFYLGQVELKNGNIPYAETAFEKASKGEFNKQVQEEAFFALAKLKFDSKLRAQSIALLQNYIDTYSDGKYINEANQYLSEAFLTSNNYDAAIKHIEGLKNKSQIILETYQKVTFYKGVEFFNNSDFKLAISHFEKSLDHPYDKKFVVEANFWRGEALSIVQQYPAAINAYAGVFRNESNENSETFLKARYGIGYAYFNTKDYKKALEHFEKYVNALKNAEDKMYYGDAIVRIADCYLVLKNNSKALENYLLASKVHPYNKDYTYFRLGVVSWFNGNKIKAQEYLDKVLKEYKSSRYFDDALFEYANIDFENSDFQNATNGFTQLINKEESSPFLPHSFLNRGISYTNMNKMDLAIKDYRVILDKYASHKTAKDALTGLQEALHLSARDDEFDADKKKFALANPESDALITLDYEGARNQYFSGNYSKATEKFKTYIKDYKENSYFGDIYYYLGESYYNLDKADSALKYHLEVLKRSNSSFLNKSILRTGDIHFQKGKYDAAISKYTLLRHLARTRSEEIFAWQGLMLSHYQKPEYDTAIIFGQLIADQGEAAFGARNKALLLIGNSALKLNEYDKAEKYFEDCIEAGKDEHAAEALFRIAEIKSKLGDYQKSVEISLDLIGRFSHYPKWNDESFLLIAQNFYNMDELFQSKSTLESIIANSPSKTTVERAELLLDQIKAKEIKESSNKIENDTIE